MKRLLSISLALAIAACFTVATEAKAEKRFITIGTGGPTGVYFVVGNSVCRMVHKEAAEGRSEGRQHGIRCSAPSTGGSTYNIGQICQGELDFGVAQSDWQHHAYHGTNDKVNKCEKLRSVFAVHPEPYQIIASKGSGIDSLDALKGKRFNIGNPGSGQRGTTELLMDRKGWDTGVFATATELTSTEQANALCDGNIDAFGYTVGVPNAGVAVATDGCDAHLVDICSDKVVNDLVEEFPYYAKATIPEGTYKTSDKDVCTFGVMATFVTSADVPEDVVYEVTRAVFDNIEDFRNLHPAFKTLDPKTMIKDGLSAPLHPGAEKFFKEKGWM